MRVGFARPDIGSLVFRFFSRSVHPELAQVFARAELRHDAWSAQIQICDAGHLITFRHKNQSLSEVATSADHPLPHRKQLIARRLRGQRNESVQHESGIVYQVSFQVEQLDPEVFMNLHEELLLDCSRGRVAHQFNPTNRLSPSPLSVVRTEEQANSLLVHAFHTFPGNSAVLKTQSLFEIDPR